MNGGDNYGSPRIIKGNSYVTFQIIKGNKYGSFKTLTIACSMIGKIVPKHIKGHHCNNDTCKTLHKCNNSNITTIKKGCGI